MMDVRVRLVAATLLAALLLAAGSDDARAGSRADDEAIAATGVLIASDFPSSWSQGPRDHSDDDHTDAVAAKIASCRQFIAFSKSNHKNPRAESDDFTQGDSSMSNAVNMFPRE